jgi:hypothetical protein
MKQLSIDSMPGALTKDSCAPSTVVRLSDQIEMAGAGAKAGKDAVSPPCRISNPNE